MTHFCKSTTLPYAVVVQGRRLANYCCVLERRERAAGARRKFARDRGRRNPVVLTPTLLTETTADRAEAFC